MSVAKLKAPKPSACRFRGNNLRPTLSGRSKNKTLRRKNTRRLGCGGSANSTLSALACGRLCQPPAPGTRAVGCSSSATSENADFSRRVSRRTTPAWQKRRSKRCGLKARAEGTVCLHTREESPEKIQIPRLLAFFVGGSVFAPLFADQKAAKDPPVEDCDRYFLRKKGTKKSCGRRPRLSSFRCKR